MRVNFRSLGTLLKQTSLVLARLLGYTALSVLLFWAVHPLWLVVFWGLQGYPASWGDLARWYQLGAFNMLPMMAGLMATPVLMGVLWLLQVRTSLARWMRTALGALLMAGLVPPLAYCLLLLYADVWAYRAWDVMAPALLHAYLMLAPSCVLTGGVLGWLCGRRHK